MPKFTCNLIIKETPIQVYFCEFSEFLKKSILQKTWKWLVLDFDQFYMSHSIILLIKRNRKKGSYYFLNVFNRVSTSEKEIIRFKNATFCYFLQKSSTWNHSLGHGGRLEMNKWMKIFNLLWIRYKIATSK